MREIKTLGDLKERMQAGFENMKNPLNYLEKPTQPSLKHIS